MDDQISAFNRMSDSEKIAWLQELEVGYVKELNRDASQIEQQWKRISELEDKLANADMVRHYLRGENLRLEKEVREHRGTDLESHSVELSAALEDLVDCAQGLLEQANNIWQSSKQDGA